MPNKLHFFCIVPLPIYPEYAYLAGQIAAMKVNMLVLFLLALSTANAQEMVHTYTAAKVESDYQGGKAAWLKFLGKTMHYPNDAVDNEIQGIVWVTFQVDTLGNPSDIRAISGPEKGGLREEAVRVISLSSNWIPQSVNGLKITTYFKTPLKFKLEKG
jgi:TonB family protein